MSVLPCGCSSRAYSVRQAEEQALHPSAPEAAKLPTAAPSEPPKKKKKGPKGPNPLSVKKKKPKPSDSATKMKDSSVMKALGEKRKRDDEDDVQPSTTASEDVGQKRKRRRKHGTRSSIDQLPDAS